MTDGFMISHLGASPTAVFTLAQQGSTYALPWWTVLLAVLFLVICVIMILTVLIQRPQGGGLSGAFGSGGGGSGQTAFGARTGDALTIATVGIFVIYLAVAVGLNYMAQPSATTTPLAISPAPGELPAEEDSDSTVNEFGATDGAQPLSAPQPSSEATVEPSEVPTAPNSSTDVADPANPG